MGARIIDLIFVRDRTAKRELKLLNALLLVCLQSSTPLGLALAHIFDDCIQVKTTLWKTLFGKEADKLEHANDDERTYYIIEKEPIVNTFISVPKVISFPNILMAHILPFRIRGVSTVRHLWLALSKQCWTGPTFLLRCCLSKSFEVILLQVSAHWHKGTTFMVKFEEEVIARDRAAE